MTEKIVSTSPQETVTRHDPLNIGKIFPTGEVDLPPVEVQMINPYRDRTTAYVMAALFGGAGGLSALVQKKIRSAEDPQPPDSESLIDQLLQTRMTRRQFLKRTAITLGAASLGSLGSVIEPVNDALVQALYGLHDYIYFGYTDFKLFQEYIIRANLAELRFKLRDSSDDLLYARLTESEPVIQHTKPVGVIHKFAIGQMLSLMATDRYSWGGVSEDKDNLMIYEATRGCLAPRMHPDPTIISARADIFHKEFDTPMAACFNATAPQALAIAEAVKLKYPQKDELAPNVGPIVYGSSSLFIPSGTPADSPIWQHAANKLLLPNYIFEELNFRKGDPSHNAVGFRTDGSICMISQLELVDMVRQKKLRAGLDSVALNQFCFDPSENKGLPENFRWSNNVHRNANMLLVTEDGRQMIMSGSLDYLLRNVDYLNLIRAVERTLKVKFVLATCLDVGLAGGFVIRTDDGRLNKPIEPSFHDNEGNLNMGLHHTSSILLIHQTDQKAT